MARNQAASNEGRGRRRLLATTGVAVLAAGGVSVGLALGAGGSPTLKSSHVSKLNENVVADSSGRTAYTLSGESKSHLKCTSSTCTQIWQPVTVHSRTAKLKAGKGVHGKLAVLSRGMNVFQVTLGGKPLYRFSGDSGPGQANGEGITSFGGTWHVVKASASPSGSTHTNTQQSTSTTPSHYTPPGY